MPLYDSMYVIPVDQYRSLSQTKCDHDKLVGSIRGDVNGGQVNHIEIGEGGRVVIKPSEVLASNPPKKPRGEDTFPPPPSSQELETNAGKPFRIEDVLDMTPLSKQVSVSQTQTDPPSAVSQSVQTEKPLVRPVSSTATNTELPFPSNGHAYDNSRSQTVPLEKSSMNVQLSAAPFAQTAQTKEFSVQTDPEQRAVAVSDFGIQTDPEPKPVSSSTGTQYRASNTHFGVQTDRRPLSATVGTQYQTSNKEFGVQTEPEQRPTSSDLGVQVGPSSIERNTSGVKRSAAETIDFDSRRLRLEPPPRAVEDYVNERLNAINEGNEATVDEAEAEEPKPAKAVVGKTPPPARRSTRQSKVPEKYTDSKQAKKKSTKKPSTASKLKQVIKERLDTLNGKSSKQAEKTPKKKQTKSKTPKRKADQVEPNSDDEEDEPKRLKLGIYT